MRTLITTVFAAIVSCCLLLAGAGPASAQEAQIGQIVATPATVAEAGTYTLAAEGSGWIPNSNVLLVGCTAPGSTLVPGEASEEDVVAAAGRIDPLANCNLVTAQSIDIDDDGNFASEMEVEIDANFFFSAGALDGSQAGAVWVPIIADGAAATDEPAEEEPAEEEPAEEEPAEEEPAEEEPAEEEPAEEEAAEEEPADEEAAEEEPAPLAETGVESAALTIIGATVLAAGLMVASEARRH